MHRRLSAISLLALVSVAASGCDTNVSTRDNPYDPQSTSPAPASIFGQVNAVGRTATAERAANEGITVDLLQESDGTLADVTQLTTDAEGSFRFADLRPGNYVVQASESGFEAAATPRVAVAAADIVSVGTITLLRDQASLATLNGTVLLEGADPLAPDHAGTLVRVIGRADSTLTGTDGSFTLELPADTYNLELSRADYVTQLAENIALGEGEVRELEEIVLIGNPGTIAGSVMQKTCTVDPLDAESEPSVGASATVVGAGYSGTTVADGTFAIQGVLAGTYAVEISKAGFDSPEQAQSVRVRGGRTVTLPSVTVLQPSRGSLKGRIQLSGETDHSGVQVTVTGTDWTALTTTAGDWLITGVCAGPGYEVTASKDRFVTATAGGIEVVGGSSETVPTITMERQQGGLTLHGGSDFTNVNDVAYQLAAPGGTTEMRMSEEQALFSDPLRSDEGWVAYLATGTVTLSAGEGTKTVFAQVRGGGAVSGILEDLVILDQTAPSNTSLEIESGSGFSKDPDGAVLITLLASETALPPIDRVSGLADVQLVNLDLQNPACATPPCTPTQADWDAATPNPYNRVVDHPLLRPLVDEEKEVWVRFSDRAGNWSAPVSARVVLDREVPFDTFIDINFGDLYARSDRVTLTLDADDTNAGANNSLLLMRLANTEGFGGAIWQPFSAQVTWFLDGRDDGPKSVYVEFMDVAGNRSPSISDDITLDRALPVARSLSVVEGRYSSSPNVNLALDAADSTLMLVADNASFLDGTGSPLTPDGYSTTYAFSLPSVERDHTIFVKFLDDAGNESATLTATVYVDLTAPAVSGVTLADGVLDTLTGWVNVTTSNVTVLTTAIPGPLDAHEMKLDVVELDMAGNETGRTPGTFQSYAPSRVVSLPTTETRKRIELTLQDAAGNVSPISTIELVYDATPPAITTVAVQGGAAFTASPQVDVDLTVTDPLDAFQMQVSNRGDFAGALWQPYAASLSWSLPSVDQLHTIHVRIRDVAGNIGSGSGTITLDRSPPVGLAVELDAGAAYTTDLDVDVVLTANDSAAGMAYVEISNDPGFTTKERVDWLPAGAASVSRAAWTLPAADGLATVYTRFFDTVGNSVIATGAIIVDRADPVGTVVIDDGADFATAAPVTLRFTAPADTTQVAMANGPIADCASPPNAYEAYTQTKSWSLDDLTDGLKTVTVCFRDAAGNTASASDTITLDTSPPTGTVRIDADAAKTRDRAVELTLTASPDVVQMALVNGGSLDCATAAYEPLSNLRAWTLPVGDGSHSVTVCFRDAAGLTGTDTDDIVLDTTAPAGTVTVTSTGGYVTSTSVDIDLSFPGDVDAYALGNGGLDCGTAGYTTVTVGTVSLTVTGHSLPSGDGPKTVFACFRDEAGNTALASQTVILDTSAPAGTVRIADGASWVIDANVTLYFSAPSDTVQVAVVDGATIDCGTASYQGFSSTLPWLLAGGDGTKTVSVCFKDGAGLTASASDTIGLDTVSPTVSVTINGGDAFTSQPSVVVDLVASADVVSMAVAEAASLDCATAAYQPYSARSTFTLSAGNGAKTLSVCVRDPSGRTGGGSAGITLDQSTPSGTISLDTGAAYTTDLTLDVALGFPDDTDGYALADGVADCAAVSYTTVAVGTTVLSTTWTIPTNDGTKTVSACFRDQAGNLSWAADDIILDTEAPVGTVSIDAGAAYALATGVTLYFTAPSDINRIAVVDGATIDCGTAGYQGWSTSLPWTLPAGDGPKTVSVCFEDRAGLRTSSSDTIVLDTADPTGTVLIDSGAAFARERAVDLSVTADADVISMSIVNGATLDCATAAYVPVQATTPWTLPSGDGTKSVTICFKDAAGRTGSDTDDIELDTQAPGGTLSLAGGAAYATGTTVTVDLTFPNDTDGYALADAALFCAGATYTSVNVGDIAATTNWTLPVGDGPKAVVACFRDEAGNTASAADTIVLDTTPPVGTIRLDQGAEYALSTSVTAYFTAPADIDEMSVVEAASLDCATAAYENYATSKPLVLGGQGVRTVSVCFKDLAGLTAYASDTIIVDSVDPSGSLTIDAGATHTRTRAVDLGITASADVVAIAFADGASIDCAAASYEPYSATRAWTLPANEGSNFVSMCLKDGAGRTASFSDSITLDTQPPDTATITIDGGNAYTTLTTALVDLGFTTPEPVTVAIANESLDCTSASYGPYNATVIDWPLLDTDGIRTVVACFKDAAGWIVSKSDTITMDRSPPTGSVLVDGGSVYTTDDLVDLSFSYPADTVQMAVANGGLDCATAAYIGVAPSLSNHDLDPADDVANDGPKTVSVCFKDGAGLTAGATVTVILDRVNPTGATLTIAGGATHTRFKGVPVLVSGAPADVAELAWAENSLDCGSAQYAAFTASFNHTLSEPDGGKTLVACLRDRAGRTAQISDTITLDRIAPSGSIEINNDDEWATSATVVVDGASADAVEYSLAAESIDCTAASYDPISGGTFSSTATLLGFDGVRTMRACLRDEAGNTVVVDDDIKLDTTPPRRPTVRIDDGALITADELVDLTISATDNFGVARMHLSTDRADGGWENYSETKADWDITGPGPGSSGWGFAWVRVEDAAGWPSDWGVDVIRVDLNDPVLSRVQINGNAAITNSTGVTVDVSATDTFWNLSFYGGEMMLSESNLFIGAKWQPFSAETDFRLSSGGGTKTIYAKVRDASGRESATLSDSILLDGDHPVISSIAIRGPFAEGVTPLRDVKVDVTAWDNMAPGARVDIHFVESFVSCDPGVVTYTAGNFSPCAAGVPCYREFDYTLVGDPGEITVYACLKDDAGNYTPAPITASIFYDDTAPSTAPAGLTAFPRSGEVDLAWTPATDDPGSSGIGSYLVEWSTDGFATVAGSQQVPFPPVPFDDVQAGVAPQTTTTVTGLANQEPYWFRVAAVDASGRPSAPSAAVETLPGLRRGVVTFSAPDDYLVGTPSLAYADGNLYLTTMGGTDLFASRPVVHRCNLVDDNCSSIRNWVETELPSSGTAFRPMTFPIVATTDRLLVGGIEVDTPVVWTCEPRLVDCDVPGNWDRWLPEPAPLTLAGPDRVDLAVGDTGYMLTYTRDLGATEVIRTAICGKNVDCSISANWRISDLAEDVPVGLSGGDYPSNVAVRQAAAAAEDVYWVAFREQVSESIWIAACREYSYCDGTGDWATFELTAAVADEPVQVPDLVVTPGRVYAAWTTEDNDGPFHLARCNKSSNCDSITEWTRSSWSPYAPFVFRFGRPPALRLAYTPGVLHGVWHEPGTARVHYGLCKNPDTADCTAEANWVWVELDRFVGTYSHPAVAAVGSDIAIAWRTDGARVSVAVPIVTSPDRHVAGPGENAVVSTWSAVPTMDGYALAYDDGSGEALWTIPDPGAVVGRIATPVGTDYSVAARTRAPDGTYSSDARRYTVRAFRHGDTGRQLDPTDFRWFLGGLNTNFSYTGNFSLIRAGSYHYMIRRNSADANSTWISRCATSADCSSPGNWLDYKFGNSAATRHDLATDGTYLAASWSHGTNEVTAAWCPLSSGCDQSSDWSAHLVVQSGVNGPGTFPQIAVGGGTVFVATRNASDQLTLHNCAVDTVNCSLGASWFKDAVVDTTAGNGEGHTLASGTSYMALMQPLGDDLLFYRCWHNSNCDATGDFASTVVITRPTPLGFPNDELPLRLNLPVNSVFDPMFIVQWHNDVVVGHCPDHLYYCANGADRWSTTKLDRVTFDVGGIGVDLSRVGSGATTNRVAAWIHNKNLRMAVCRHDCGFSENWHTITDGLTANPNANIAWNNSSFMGLEDDGSITIGWGNSFTDSIHVWTDGLMLPEQ